MASRGSRRERDRLARLQREALERPAHDVPSLPISERVTFQGSYFSGPLPDPDTLSGYGAIVDGGAERIFAQWEKQSEHRQKMEGPEMTLRYLGWFSGSVILAGLIFFGYDLTKNGLSTGGLVALLNASAWIIGMFLLGRAQRRQPKE